ncbi:hypothetical protein [Streptomyces niveiscabiei]|uniref:Secreted protein n=1 Tax=Streptomyces niveiscabiei TaxID=164115 RepID=A0ABW9I9P2_9ACTN
MPRRSLALSLTAALAVMSGAFATPAQAASGSLSVRNYGGYVARFTVAYDLHGTRQSEDSGDFTLGVNKQVAVPDGATNIDLKVEEYWLPGLLTTIFTKHFNTPETRCYRIHGTTLAPGYEETSC